VGPSSLGNNIHRHRPVRVSWSHVVGLLEFIVCGGQRLHRGRHAKRGDDAYVAKRGCGCIVPAYQKAGGNLRALTDYFQLMENHVSLNDDERDLRVSKELDRPGADKAALKAAGTKCKPVYDRAMDNDPNS
jgi:hypothetical protein